MRTALPRSATRSSAPVPASACVSRTGSQACGADGVGEAEDGQLPQRVRGQHGDVRVAVDGRVALEDVHGEALVGEEERRGEAGDACAQHEQRYGNHGSPRSPERTRQG